MKKRLGPVERLFPMPCALVVGGTMSDADTLAVAWLNIVSSTPPTIALGLRESRRTLELIHETRSFSVNIPRASDAAVVDYCGLESGRRADKFTVAGLSLLPGIATRTPIIEQCPYNIECRVTDEVPVGSYRIVLGEVIEARADEDILVDQDSDLIDMDRLDPLVYIAGVREYRRLGEKVADAFSAGRAFMHEDNGS